MSTISIRGDVWRVVDEYEMSIPVDTHLIVYKVTDNGMYLTEENWLIWDEAIINGWVKRVDINK